MNYAYIFSSFKTSIKDFTEQQAKYSEKTRKLKNA